MSKYPNLSVKKKIGAWQNPKFGLYLSLYFSYTNAKNVIPVTLGGSYLFFCRRLPKR